MLVFAKTFLLNPQGSISNDFKVNDRLKKLLKHTHLIQLQKKSIM